MLAPIQTAWRGLAMNTSMRIACAAFAVVCALALSAGAVTTGIPASGLPTAAHYSAALLPETAGIVPWRTLAQIETEQVGLRVVTRFSREILELDQKDVKVQGFIVPLDVGERQKRFLLSAVPPECPFCLPAGPEALVEVQAKTPVRYGVEPIVVSGRFAVLKDEDGGLLYRLTNAEASGPAAPAPAAAPSAAPSSKR
jgi:uncharacterized protein